MKTIYVLLIALVACTFSCRTKNGEAGTPGPAGESTLTKQGTISGVITFQDVAERTQTFPYNYEYFESIDESKYYPSDVDSTKFDANFSRRELKDYANFATFEVTGYRSSSNMNDVQMSGYFKFSIQKIMGNLLYQFNHNGSNFTITNINFNKNTGRLTFEFENNDIMYRINSEEKYASMKGNVDVVLNRTTVDMPR